MLYAIIGKPGEGKSYFSVTKIYEFQQLNLENIKKNVPIFAENRTLLEERDLLEKDYTFTYEIGNELFTKTCSHSYFDKLEDGEQFEYYFEYYFFYNKYIEQIYTEEQLKLTAILPVRQLYSNINGLKIDGVLPFPDLDWIVTPWGSDHFIDEVRDCPPYNWDGRKYSEHRLVKGMSKVRHTDKNVFLITQDSEDLNYSLRKLVDKLYFVKRPPQKVQACGIYVFDKYLSDPRAAADSTRDPKKYIEHFILPYRKKFQRMYVSASSHSSMKFNMSWKVFGYIFLFLMIIVITVVGVTKIPIFSYAVSAFKQMTGQESSALDQLKTGGKPAEQPKNSEPSDHEQAASQPTSNMQNTTGESRNQQFEYDVNRPYDFNPPVLYELQQRPRLAGCIASKSSCSCYTQQATKIYMSQKDCRRYVSGDRPFDYFTREQDRQFAQMPSQIQPMSQNQTAPSDFDAKYHQFREENNRANNVVYETSSLSSRPINAANAM
ncbi:zonular occludens toxin domain-containing protein [Acinetobacter colistiniresistens]|uniref:zonular occludens toxin domain-containing protein n=1 Tax=Acinetobacter colistiniresistens TaxID=280145 RepID=UPI000DCF7FB2|nr:zonular occludens toxin domain-containing protein [Acinetobacter colistiniresistens]